MVRPVIHSIKHYVQNSLETVVGGAVVAEGLITAVAPESVDAANEVVEGAVIKAVYLEVWIRAGDTVGASGQMVVYKSQSDTANPTATNMAALHDWSNKRNILYTTMGLFNDQDADAIAAFKGWIKIPKGKQRFALGDRLNWSIFTPTIDLHVCGFCTYKEYT